MKLSRWPWILLILGLMVSPAVADESPVTFHPYAGDVSKDAYLDARDALAVLQYSVGLVAFDPDQERAGDTNGDGSIDAGDALIVLQTSVGVQDPLRLDHKGCGRTHRPGSVGHAAGLIALFPRRARSRSGGESKNSRRSTRYSSISSQARPIYPLTSSGVPTNWRISTSPAFGAWEAPTAIR